MTQNANPAGGLDPKEFVCLGTYFRNAGYDAAYSGKWHLCFNVEGHRGARLRDASPAKARAITTRA